MFHQYQTILCITFHLLVFLPCQFIICLASDLLAICLGSLVEKRAEPDHHSSASLKNKRIQTLGVFTRTSCFRTIVFIYYSVYIKLDAKRFLDFAI